MSACDDVRAHAAGLASLPASDPERQSAYAHAATCAACAEALADGGRLLAVLDAAPALPPPSEAALARARAAVLQEFDRASATARVAAAAPAPANLRWPLPAAVLAVLVGLAGLEGAAHAAPSALLSAGVLGACALVVAVGSLSRGAWALGFGLLASGLFSLVVALQSPAAQGLSLGTRCSLFDLGGMILPLGTALYLGLRRSGPHSTVSLAAAAVAGGLAGQAALHFGCGNHTLTHLLVFHSGAVGLAALVGASSAKLFARAA